MIKKWPVKPIECFVCYDTGEVIDPFKQNERVRCRCQQTMTAGTRMVLKILWHRAGQIGEINKADW